MKEQVLTGQARGNRHCMLVVEASAASEPFDESVQDVGSTNPLVEGEVLTSGVAKNPIPLDKEDELWIQGQLAATLELSLPENPQPNEQTETGRDVVQRFQRTQAQTILAAQPE